MRVLRNEHVKFPLQRQRHAASLFLALQGQLQLSPPLVAGCANARPNGHRQLVPSFLQCGSSPFANLSSAHRQRKLSLAFTVIVASANLLSPFQGFSSGGLRFFGFTHNFHRCTQNLLSSVFSFSRVSKKASTCNLSSMEANFRSCSESY